MGLIDRLMRRPGDSISEETLAALAPASGPPARVGVKERAAGIERVLARKVLQAHLRERRVMMQTRPADLRDLDAGEARLLIRAMGAAGHADGALDERELRRIRAALSTTVLDPSEREALAKELENPPCLESLARQVDRPETAVRFYAVSLIAAERGKASNTAYLDYVAQRLSVPADVVIRLNRRFNIPI